MFVIAYMLLVIMGPIPNVNQSSDTTTKIYYVPKSKRWKRTRAVGARLSDYGKKIWTRVLGYESTWKEHWERTKTRKRIKAIRIMAGTFVEGASQVPHYGRRYPGKPPPWHQRQMLMANDAVAMETTNSEGEPVRENISLFDTDAAKIGIDNRCSACISYDINDFDGPVTKVNRAIKGFGGERTFNVYQGTIVWKWCDNEGEIHRFRIPNSYYVPEGKVRLLSPQHWARTQIGSSIKRRNGTGETTTATKTVLFWNNNRNKLDVNMGINDNVATFYLAPGFNKFSMFCQMVSIDYNEQQEDPLTAEDTQVVSDTEDDDDDDLPPMIESTRQRSLWSRLTGLPISRQRNQEESDTIDNAPSTTIFNLDGPARSKPVVIEEEEDKQPTTVTSELLRYHHRFGHVSFSKLQNMARQNIIPRRLADCNVPACSACLFAKATRRRWRDKRRRDWTEKRTAIGPGEVVSVDQLVSPTPGLVAQLTGKLTTKRYKYATVYVDQYSGFSYVYLQKTADADETILGKKAFEALCRQYGVKVINYHADNGIFRANKWIDECRRNGQGLTFAGVNAHHSNGLAERRIRSLQDLTRAMLIHSNRRWTMASTANLWPYALRMANDAINETPNLKDPEGRSPAQLFSKSHIHTHAKHWMPFGCPVYVLENELQTGKGIHHKWEYRSKVGIYLGRSPSHGRNVALVLDRNTGLVSPQFHVTFDPSFHTVKQDSFDTLWQLKAGFLSSPADVKERTKKGSSKETIFQKRPMPEQEGDTSQGTNARMVKRAKKSGTTNKSNKSETIPSEDSPSSTVSGRLLQQPSNDSQLDSTTPERPANKAGQAEPSQKVDGQSEDQTTSPQFGSQQTSVPTQTLIETMMVELSKATVGDIQGEIFCYSALFPNYAGLPEQDPLQVFKATADPDTMYMHEAMKQHDADEFRKAMEKEWKDQMGNGNFTILERSKVPEGAAVLPAVWQMKRKRDIKTRQVKKYKARLNIDGSRMKHGVHYDQTYAPVASWNSIRTLLIMSALHKWHTRQIDYVLAFPQAPVEREIYMEIPKGFKIDEGNTKDYVLKLHRNVYGQKQASRVWNKYLSNILINKVGFKQSKVDECVFYRGNVMYVLYTDDSILAGPDLSEIDKAIQDIQAAELDITIEGDIQDFLGINIERREDGTIHLTQPHLIDQVIKDLKLPENATTKSTPAASSKLLSRHSDSKPFDGSFHYRSVIGKLNYLEKGSRPDIAFIVHQCARFCETPKVEHGNAIRWVVKYLKGTRNRGVILNPNSDLGLEVFVDADFAGNWDPKEFTDRDTARSRHGYIIQFAGCPILWKSQLQNEVALSSTESEYTGLSYALRDAIPVMNLFKEMIAVGMKIKSSRAKVHCRVFEDNSGALEIAKVPKFRPRTKHLNCRLHHFRSYVDDTKEISIHKIDTLEQPADFLTKPLSEELLVKLRKKVMGW